MLIKKLILHNIRSYINEEINFPTGSVLLSGDVGCGKSSILLAVEFALFGTDNERLSGNALLRTGAAEGYAELTIELDGNDIIIRRNLKAGKNAIAQCSGFIQTNGIQKESMPVELKSEIISLLGYPGELVTKKRNIIYRYSVYCPQEEMKLILSDDADSRLDTLRKLFGIDKYKRVTENCAILTREMRSSIKEMEARAEGLENKKQKLTEIENCITAAIQKLEMLAPSISQLRSQIKLKKEELSKTEESQKQYLKLASQLDVLEAQLSLKTDMLSQSEKKKLLLNETLDAIKPDMTSQQLKLVLETRGKSANEKMNKRNILENKLVSMEETLSSIAAEISVDFTDELDKKNQKLKELNMETLQKQQVISAKEQLELAVRKLQWILKEYEVKLKQVEENKHLILKMSYCPTCRQNVSKEHKDKIHSEEHAKIDFLAAKLKETQQVLTKHEEELLSLNDTLEYLKELEKRAAIVKSEIDHLVQQQNQVELKKKKYSSLCTEKELLQKEFQIFAEFDYEKELAEIASLKAKLERLQERERAEKDLKELAALCSSLENDITAIEQSKKALVEKQSTLTNAEEMIVNIKNEVQLLSEKETELLMQQSRLSAEKTSLSAQFADINSEIKVKQDFKESAARNRQYVHWLDEYFSNLMSTIERHVMLRIFHEFNELFKEWFSILMQDNNMNARIDDSFTPVVEQNGYEVDVNYLSGGERTSVALAYRLALNRVMNDIIQTIRTRDLIILDEPTEGFSSEQLDRIREVLYQLNVKQVIIVSHENKIESFVDNVIKVVKVDGISRVAN